MPENAEIEVMLDHLAARIPKGWKLRFTLRQEEGGKVDLILSGGQTSYEASNDTFGNAFEAVMEAYASEHSESE